MKKRIFSILCAAAMVFSLTACGSKTETTDTSAGASAAASGTTDIAILVPNADHGWTGAVMTYAQAKADEINKAGKYTAKVITATDSANQISEVEDLISLPQCLGARRTGQQDLRRRQRLHVGLHGHAVL